MSEFNMEKFVQKGHEKFLKRTRMSKEKMYKMIGKEAPKSKALAKAKK